MVTAARSVLVDLLDDDSASSAMVRVRCDAAHAEEEGEGDQERVLHC